MTASPGIAEEDRLTREARTVALLGQSTRGSRGLDQLVALALGWERRAPGLGDEGYQVWWRRFRPAWSREAASVPPRYTSSLTDLIGELPRHQVVTLRIAPDRSTATIGEPPDCVVALGYTPELALANALVQMRCHARGELA